MVVRVMRAGEQADFAGTRDLVPVLALARPAEGGILAWHAA